jgi:hypothetical protein
MWVDAAHLSRREQERNGHKSTSVPLRITPARVAASKLTGPEPSIKVAFFV